MNKVKNNIKLISLVVCLAAIILSCCSCGKCKDGEHKFKATTIKDATCTDEGLVGYKCDKCGYEEEKSTSAMGHNYTQQSTTATCTKDGKATYKCSRCGDIKEEEVKASGHSWIDATCKEPKHCSRCGATEGSKTNNHNFVGAFCTVCGKENTKTITCQGVNFVVPVEFSGKHYDTSFEVSDVAIKFEGNYSGYSSFYVNYSVKCIKNSSYGIGFKYSLYDKDGYVVTSGNEYSTDLNAGEKSNTQSFEIQLQHINGTDLKAGATYELKFSQNQ